MGPLIARLDSFVARRRAWILIGWIVVVAAAFPFFLRQYDHLTEGGWEVSGSQSLAAQEAISRSFPKGQGRSLMVVLRAQPDATPAGEIVAVERVKYAADRSPSFSLDRAAVLKAERELSVDGVAVVPLTARGIDSELIDSAVVVRDQLGSGEVNHGIQTYVTGKASLWAGLHDISRENIAEAERIGLPLVLLILLLVFGSLAAASLQAALAVVSVIITGAGIFFISQQIDMSVFSVSVATLIGIGVAVDYALFILARYRQERAGGASADTARQVALATSGKAVIFSGTTVVVSLASLWMTDSTLFHSIAIGTIMVVAVAVLAAIVLLPAMIVLLGERLVQEGPLRRAFAASWSRARRAIGMPKRSDFWSRWVASVMRHPLAVVLVVSTVLVAMAVPALFIKTGDPALTQFPADHEVSRGAELAAQQVGAGATGPVQLVATFNRGLATDPANRAATARMVEELRADPQVRAVERTQTSGSQALIVAIPRDAAEGDTQLALLDRVRSEIVPASELATVASVDAGGPTAAYADIVELVSSSMGRIIAFVLIFSFLTMLVLLRSIVLPLKAIVMNMLSIGAAYGVLVMVFQWGWLDGLLGLESLGRLNVIAIPVVMAVAFGLSMDYEVFLLSRIRERYELTGDNRLAVAEGLSASARTITSAALIMVCVFGAFAATSVPAIQQIGLGAAVAIALDATLVRLALVPAIMELMGRANWWLPDAIARLFPKRPEPKPQPQPSARP